MQLESVTFPFKMDRFLIKASTSKKSNEEQVIQSSSDNDEQITFTGEKTPLSQGKILSNCPPTFHSPHFQPLILSACLLLRCHQQTELVHKTALEL